ncbi:MAG: hypothetical protein AB8B47_06060 [Roseobacter sp.]
MKKLAMLIFVCALAAPVAHAQDDEAPSLMERGAQQFLEGLLQEMEPAFEGMRGFMDEMGPALVDLMDEIKDWSLYAPPEVLENGDIIIRRKPKPEPAPEVAEPLPQVEL